MSNPEGKTKRGRPPQPVPQDKVDAICEWISQGQTLRQWCRENGIHYSTVYLWLEKDQDFAKRFARARDIGADCIADEAIDIADTLKLGIVMKSSDRGVEEIHEDMLGHRKLQIETRLKLLAKWFPQKYGERVALAGDKSAPIEVNQTIDATKLSTETLAEIMAARDAAKTS